LSTGLVLGKFAPLHRGHQLLIDRALAENDRVLVLIWQATDITDTPLPVRSGWVRTLYPDVEILEAWDGPLEEGESPEIKRLHEVYILDILDGRTVDRFYSSAFWGEHVSRALGAEDCRIDPERKTVPVPGSEIREFPYAHRRYIHPFVYRDLITKIVFLGAPSTGKSSLARELAKLYETQFMPEYGREYWEKYQQDRRLSPEQLLEIATGHLEREESLIRESQQRIFVDTDATTTYIFALYYHGFALKGLEDLADACLSRYDLFFLCDDDIPFEDTWERSGEGNRFLFQQQIKADLLRRKIPFITLSGSFETRIAKARSVIDAYKKYHSLGNALFQL